MEDIKKKKAIKTSEGLEVDASTGEVLDDRPIDFEHPEYRIFDYIDYLRRAHYHPLGKTASSSNNKVIDTGLACRDEEGINRILDKILPGLVAVLRSLLLASLCESRQDQTMPGFDILKRVVETRMNMSVGEAMAYDTGGFIGLIVYRCLKNAGIDDAKVLEALRGREGIEGAVQNLVEELKNSLSKSFNSVLVRWISRPSGDIDLDHASKVFNTPVKRARRALQIVTKVDRFGIQITSRKVDVSSSIDDKDRVLEVLDKLSRKLGIELSAPQPMVATVVLKLPFEIDLENLKKFQDNAVNQGTRVKMEGSYWTALIFKRTLNIYVDLQGNIGRFRSAVAEVLPSVCRFAKISLEL